MPRAVDTHAAPAARLRVLLVEGCAPDADLLMNALRQSGFDASYERVDTERDYLAHLTASLDVIVADDTLPGLGALRALTLLRERDLDIPFIVVSGATGEEQAVAAMKIGAADYLSRDRLAGLGIAVRDALDAAALRRADAGAVLTAHSCAAIVDVAFDGIFIIDEAGRITEFNRAAAQMFGRARADAIGRPIGDLLLPSATSPDFGDVGTVTAGIEPGRRVEMTARHVDGTCFPVELALSRLRATGKMEFAGLIRDISERKAQEAAILEREAAQARLAAIVEATTDLIYIRMLDGSGPTYMNRAGRAMLGLDAQEPVPDLAAFRTKASLTEWTDVILPAALRDGLWSGETTFVSRGGLAIPVSQLLLAHPAQDGRIQLSTIARDLTDRRRTEAALRASDERMRFALQAAGMGVWDYHVPTRHVTWTEMRPPDDGRRAGHFAGTADEFLAATHADDRDAVRQEIERAIVERQDLAIVFRTVTAGGTTRWIECRGRVLCEGGTAATRLVGVSTNVTARKLLEAQLRQAQKMEAIGQLAGGVAHDFNNLLTAILGYAKFAADSLPAKGQCRNDIEEIIKAARRATALTRQLLAFSRTQVLQTTLVDLNALVTGVSDMFRRLIGEHIVLDLVLAGDLALVRADAGQLEQVVMNLVVNARDAMEQGGRLTIRTANVELHASSGLPHQVVLPGWYVMVAVADDGIGMDETTKRHLFEPFFTTKERGKGTGLGLATVYGIVKQSDGYIWIDSEPGRGSTFTVYLPRTESRTEAAIPEAPSVPRHEASETVLLVEDEHGVRDLARRMLEHAGYRVLAAANGPEAEVMFAEHADSIELLISDVVMPGMSGPELFRRLAARHPGLKVVYISGYASDAMARQLKVDRGQPLVQKPFTADQLVSYVRAVIDGRPAPESKGAA